MTTIATTATTSALPSSTTILTSQSLIFLDQIIEMVPEEKRYRDWQGNCYLSIRSKYCNGKIIDELYTGTRVLNFSHFEMCCYKDRLFYIIPKDHDQDNWKDNDHNPSHRIYKLTDNGKILNGGKINCRLGIALPKLGLMVCTQMNNNVILDARDNGKVVHFGKSQHRYVNRLGHDKIKVKVDGKVEKILKISREKSPRLLDYNEEPPRSVISGTSIVVPPKPRIIEERKRILECLINIHRDLINIIYDYLYFSFLV